MSPQAREAIQWIALPESPNDAAEVKTEILRRWGTSVWLEVLGFSLACVIRDNTERLLKEHT